MKVRDLLEESCKVSNVTLACRDGNLGSHKIVLARVSSFIKNILADIPVGDNVTIIMPDYPKAQVDLFLKTFIFKEDFHRQSEYLDLLAALGKNARNNLTGKVKSEKMYEKVEQIMKIECDVDEDEKNFTNEMNHGASSLRLTRKEEGEQGHKEVNWEKGDVTNVEGNCSDYSPHETKMKRLRNRKIKRDKIDFAAHAAALNIDVEKNIREFEEDVISNPHCPEDHKRNNLLGYKINIQKAMRDLINGVCETYKQAAEKYGISSSTLHRMFLKGDTYTGRGRFSTFFTREEEKYITKRVLEVTDGGRNYSLKILRQIVEEEVSLMKINFPDQQIKNPTKKMLHNFAQRNGLAAISKAKTFNKRLTNQYHCDLCGKSYSLKNSLVFHSRKVHFL